MKQTSLHGGRFLVAAARGHASSHARGEIRLDAEVLREVGGEDRLDDEEPQPLPLCRLQALQEIVLLVGVEERPRRRRVVVLEHGAVVVKERL